MTTDGNSAATGDDVDALMRASKVVTGAIAHSLAVAEARLSLPQLRILVMVDDRGPLNMSAVAEGLGVNPSNASRACDRLVSAGLLDRREDPEDRRNVALTLTAAGRRLVDSMMRQRRTIFGQVVEQMSHTDRRHLTEALDAFNDAAGDLSAAGAGLADGDGQLLRWLV